MPNFIDQLRLSAPATDQMTAKQENSMDDTYDVDSASDGTSFYSNSSCKLLTNHLILLI